MICFCHCARRRRLSPSTFRYLGLSRSGAHEWGREFVKLGREVRMFSPKMVRPFIQRNKTDAADAQAIWAVARQPGGRFVAFKSEAQQVILTGARLSRSLRLPVSHASEGRQTAAGALRPFVINLQRPMTHRHPQPAIRVAAQSICEQSR